MEHDQTMVGLLIEKKERKEKKIKVIMHEKKSSQSRISHSFRKIIIQTISLVAVQWIKKVL